MTIEELAVKVGALSYTDLQGLLSRLGLTVSDCAGENEQKMPVGHYAMDEFHSIIEQARNSATPWREYAGPIK